LSGKETLREEDKMQAKGITYRENPRRDIITLVSKDTMMVVATKRINKEQKTPKYEGLYVYREGEEQ